MNSQYTITNPCSLWWTRWLPAVVGVCAFALTILLWQNLKIKERIRLESAVESKTRNVQGEAVSQLVPQVQGLIRMARRFGGQNNMIRAEWEKDASLYIEHFPSYRAISWAEPAGHLQWIVPLRGNGELQSLDIFSNRPKTAGEMTRGKDDVGVSPAMDLAQGDKVIFVYIPIFGGTDEFKGYIVGVFSIAKLWDNILKHNAFHDISVHLYENKQEIYRQANYKEAVDNLTNEALVNFYGISWRMQVRPLRQWVEKQDTLTSYAVLCFGTVMAFLLSLSLHFAGVSRGHAAIAESANDELARQVGVRKQTEVALRESKDLYSNIVSLIPDIVFRLDAQGRFIYISPAVVNFGFDPDILMGNHFSAIVHPDDKHIARHRFDEKRTGDRATRRVELRISPQTGKSMDCELNEVSICLSSTGLYDTGENRAFVGTQGIIRDIREQKETQEKLRQANAELEQRVRERTQALLDLNRVLHDEIKERKSTSMALLENEARLRGILDNAPVMIYLKDLQGHYCQANPNYEAFMGMSEEDILGKSDHDLFPMETAAKLIRNDDQVLKTERSQEFEEVFELTSGSHTCYSIKYPLCDVKGKIYALGVISMDITERKRAEEALRKSHHELEEAQRIARMGNWVWDIMNNKLAWSDEIYRIFGLAPLQFGASYEAFLACVHPEDRDYVNTSVNKTLIEKIPYSIDHRIVLPNGSVRIVHEQGEVAYDIGGTPVVMRGTVQDITNEKLIKIELENSHRQLSELYANLELVREEERTRIARDVHDELGQMLTALKIDLSWAKNQISPGQAPVMGKIESMLALLDSTIQAVQRITAQLRPQILDILGLVATIEWEASEFQKRTGIKTWLNVEKNIKVDGQRSTDFYRIIQEALTNVARHANASNVHVILKEREEYLLLEVRDDGDGIDQKRIHDTKSFGLVGIRERVLQHKGELAFRSSAGNGTIMSIRFPKDE